jgi:hypothetical protein
MDALVNALIAIGLLLILVLIIYLIDRVNQIEKETRKVMTTLSDKSTRSTAPFMGLSSRKLWDTMIGRGNEGLDEQALAELRSQYQVVLSKHIEALYQEGFKDGQRGMSGEPLNTKVVTTSKGQVESWIPSAQANTLYQCGLSASQTPEVNWGPLRASMDEAGLFLFSKTQLDAGSPLSDWLMPKPVLVDEAQNALGTGISASNGADSMAVLTGPAKAGL